MLEIQKPFLPSSQTLLDSLLHVMVEGLSSGTDETHAEVEAQIARIYGSRSAYDAYRAQVGMGDDHAENFERYGVVLQPKQMEFAAWARRADDADQPEEIGMGGARGPGKSFALFAQVSLDDCMRFPGLKVLYLRKTGKAAKEQLEDLARRVLRHVPAVRIKRERIDFPNGSYILIGGFNDDRQAQTYQGIENDILIVEESTQLSAKTHDILRLTNRSSKTFADGRPWRPRRYYSTNPLGIGHAYFKKRFVDNERKRANGETHDLRVKFIFATVVDNVFINEEYRQSLQELSGVERRAYLDGDWDVSAGAYFETWNYDIHVIPPITDLSWARSVWASMDFGFQHWNIFQLHMEDGDGVIYTLHELAHRKQHPDQIAPDIHALLASYRLTVDDLTAILVGTDAFAETGRARATVAQQYKQHGIYMSRAYTAPGSRVAGGLHIAKLLGDAQNGIPPRWYVTTRCPRLIESLPYMERDPLKAESLKKVNADEQGRGGDDDVDCLRYGLYKPHLASIH